jgi:ring-1,2-phenylacetyl-CoA epoxidase subunit PaaE
MVFSLFKKKKAEDSSQTVHTKYYDLKVKEVIKRTPDAISIVFEQSEESIKYLSGQFLTLILQINGEEVRRAYSLNSSPYVDENLSVTIKRVEGGLVSNYLNDSAKAGDTIKVMEAMGHFTTDFLPKNKRHIIMFAGGSGITPMISIVRSLLHEEPESIASLIYCNRNIESIIFEDQLEKIQNSFEGRFHMIHILDSAPMNWQGPSGFLNKEMLTKLFERIPDWGIDNTTHLMCGPEGMMNNVQTLLEEHHIPPEKIFRESFVAGTMKKKEPAVESGELQTREVTVLYDGEEHSFKVEPDNTILETALDNDIDLPFSCQSGLCTACRCKLISGQVKMDEDEGLSEAEKSEGYVLICVGHPLTDDVKLKVG